MLHNRSQPAQRVWATGKPKAVWRRHKFSAKRCLPPIAPYGKWGGSEGDQSAHTFEGSSGAEFSRCLVVVCRARQVHSFVPGSPAEACSDIMRGDCLVEVDDDCVIGYPLEVVATLILGKPDTYVRLTFRRYPKHDVSGRHSRFTSRLKRAPARSLPTAPSPEKSTPWEPYKPPPVSNRRELSPPVKDSDTRALPGKVGVSTDSTPTQSVCIPSCARGCGCGEQAVAIHVTDRLYCACSPWQWWRVRVCSRGAASWRGTKTRGKRRLLPFSTLTSDRKHLSSLRRGKQS